MTGSYVHKAMNRFCYKAKSNHKTTADGEGTPKYPVAFSHVL